MSFRMTLGHLPDPLYCADRVPHIFPSRFRPRRDLRDSFPCELVSSPRGSFEELSSHLVRGSGYVSDCWGASRLYHLTISNTEQWSIILYHSMTCPAYGVFTSWNQVSQVNIHINSMIPRDQGKDHSMNDSTMREKTNVVRKKV